MAKTGNRFIDEEYDDERIRTGNRFIDDEYDDEAVGREKLAAGREFLAPEMRGQMAAGESQEILARQEAQDVAMTEQLGAQRERALAGEQQAIRRRATEEQLMEEGASPYRIRPEMFGAPKREGQPAYELSRQQQPSMEQVLPEIDKTVFGWLSVGQAGTPQQTAEAVVEKFKHLDPELAREAALTAFNKYQRLAPHAKTVAEAETFAESGGRLGDLPDVASMSPQERAVFSEASGAFRPEGEMGVVERFGRGFESRVLGPVRKQALLAKGAITGEDVLGRLETEQQAMAAAQKRRADPFTFSGAIGGAAENIPMMFSAVNPVLGVSNIVADRMPDYLIDMKNENIDTGPAIAMSALGATLEGIIEYAEGATMLGKAPFAGGSKSFIVNYLKSIPPELLEEGAAPIAKHFAMELARALGKEGHKPDAIAALVKGAEEGAQEMYDALTTVALMGAHGAVSSALQQRTIEASSERTGRDISGREVTAEGPEQAELYQPPPFTTDLPTGEVARPTTSEAQSYDFKARQIPSKEAVETTRSRAESAKALGFEEELPGAERAAARARAGKLSRAVQLAEQERATYGGKEVQTVEAVPEAEVEAPPQKAEEAPAAKKEAPKAIEEELPTTPARRAIDVGERLEETEQPLPYMMQDEAIAYERAMKKAQRGEALTEQEQELAQDIRKRKEEYAQAQRERTEDLPIEELPVKPQIPEEEPGVAEAQAETRQQIAEMKERPALEPGAAGGFKPSELGELPTEAEIAKEVESAESPELPTQKGEAEKKSKLKLANEEARRNLEARLTVERPTKNIGVYGTPVSRPVVERLAVGVIKHVPFAKKTAELLDTVRNWVGELKKNSPLANAADKIDMSEGMSPEQKETYKAKKDARSAWIKDKDKVIASTADSFARVFKTPERMTAAFRVATGLNPSRLRQRIADNKAKIADINEKINLTKEFINRSKGVVPAAGDVTVVKTPRGLEQKPALSKEQKKTQAKQRGEVRKALKALQDELRELKKDTKAAGQAIPQARKDFEDTKDGQWAIQAHHREMLQMGKEAVKYGFMTQETLNEHVGQYIRHYYRQTGTTMKKIRGDIRRGFREMVGRSGTWYHRKGLTPEQAAARGLELIEDFAYASSLGQAEEARDLALGRFFQEGVIDVGLAAKEGEQKEGWRKIRGATRAKYGNLADMYLHPAIAADIEGITGATSSEFIEKHPIVKFLHKQLKKNIITRNLASHARQDISNFGPGVIVPMSFMDLLDLDISNPLAWKNHILPGLKMMKTNDLLFENFKETELYQSGVVGQFIDKVGKVESTEEFIQLLVDSQKTNEEGLLSRVDAYASKAYQFPDMLVKFLGYQKYRREGYSNADAVRLTKERTPNYQEVPAFMKRWETSAIGAPFMSFWYDSMRVFLNNITTPRGMIKYAKSRALAMAMIAMTKSMFGYDDDEMEAMRKAKYLSASYMALPIPTDDGTVFMFDPGNVSGSGWMGKALAAALKGEGKEAVGEFVEDVDQKLFRQLVIGAVMDVSRNQKGFTGKPVTRDREAEGFWEDLYIKNRKRLIHLISPILPSSIKYTVRDIGRKILGEDTKEWGKQPSLARIVARRTLGVPIERSYPLEKSEERVEKQEKKEKFPKKRTPATLSDDLFGY